tara:strand:- start:109 stop:801 length:693 start_codon:yes stop_codon:yes gene_type:complete
MVSLLLSTVMGQPGSNSECGGTLDALTCDSLRDCHNNDCYCGELTHKCVSYATEYNKRCGCLAGSAQTEATPVVELDYATIEESGNYKLGKAGLNTFYVIKSTNDAQNFRLQLPTMPSTYTLTNVEENPFSDSWPMRHITDGEPNGFLVTGTRTTNSIVFGLLFDQTGTYIGMDVVKVGNSIIPRPAVQYESLFDVNNDGLWSPGASPTNLISIRTNHLQDDGHEHVIIL